MGWAPAVIAGAHGRPFWGAATFGGAVVARWGNVEFSSGENGWANWFRMLELCLGVYV